MAFKATNVLLSEGLKEAKTLLTQMKSRSEAWATNLAGTVTADYVLSIRIVCIQTRDRLEVLKNIPGMSAYAKTQEDTPSYNIVQEFNAVNAAMDAVITEIETTFPVNNGYLLEKEFNAGVGYTVRTFTAGQVANLKTLVEAVTAEIE